MRVLLFFLWLAHFLPLPILGRIGNAIGSLMYYAIPKRRKIALINLRLCMPELSEQERVALARRHFQAYSRSIVERCLIWWLPIPRMYDLIHIDGEVPEALMKSGPTILFCPHFVCLDVGGVAARVMPLSSMYAQQKNKAFDAMMRYGRERYGPVRLFTREQGIKPILRALREGLPYFMLPDMDFGAKDAAFVPFFGVEAATLTAMGRIAATTGARVIPVVATFLPDYKGYKVKFYPPLEDFPGTDMVAAARRMNAFIEDRVRETPAEYLWTHKRFKTRPPGEPSLYDGL
ncbi:lysophospholipid acyltransferase family protein [Massilia sp. S19_KUP03_FR1]|uniref:lysophospholipid acyltransferase family protein n=1 Tax=Massilia sp. S19_KUP03_FR1 TaxID=3025503 RepID=UPI002FCDDB1D